MKHRYSMHSCEEGRNISFRKQAYFALTIIKRIGRFDGYTPQMINLLDYYLSFTTEHDWEEGQRPIVYQSLCKTAYDFGLSIRQIQRIEKALSDKGLIEHKDSPNNKRYGSRSADGGLINAFGVDLSPLLRKLNALEKTAEEKRAEHKAWASLKNSVHNLRKSIRDLMGKCPYDMDEEQHDALMRAIRPNVSSSKLRTIIHILTNLFDSLNKTAEKKLSNVDKNVVHKKNTNISNINIDKDISVLGLNNIMLSDIRNYLKRNNLDKNLYNWADIINLAEKEHLNHGISDQLWGKSTHNLSKIGASLAFLIVFNGLKRENNKIYNPGAYFAALIKRAEQNSLFLDKSLC